MRRRRRKSPPQAFGKGGGGWRQRGRGRRGVIRRTSCLSQSSRPIRLIARGAATLATRLAAARRCRIQKSLRRRFFFFSSLLTPSPHLPNLLLLLSVEAPPGSDETDTVESPQRLFAPRLPLPASFSVIFLFFFLLFFFFLSFFSEPPGTAATRFHSNLSVIIATDWLCNL